MGQTDRQKMEKREASLYLRNKRPRHKSWCNYNSEFKLHVAFNWVRRSDSGKPCVSHGANDDVRKPGEEK